LRLSLGEGANHFFDKHEEEVVEGVREYAHRMMTTPRTGQ
jgi:alpha/beta superfamily hydrolase